MKFFKKTISLLLTLAIALSLVSGCSEYIAQPDIKADITNDGFLQSASSTTGLLEINFPDDSNPVIQVFHNGSSGQIKMAQDALDNVKLVYEYFVDFGVTGYVTSSSPIKIFIDHYEETQTAKRADKTIWVQPGHEQDLQTMAHEMMHIISYHYGGIDNNTSIIRDANGNIIVSNYENPLNQQNAVHEAYSDIFAILVDMNFNPKKENHWQYGRDGNSDNRYRNISAPTDFPYPYNPNSRFGLDFPHLASLRISHAMYLMWEMGIKDIDLLAELWIKSYEYYGNQKPVITEPTFDQVRRAVIWAAIETCGKDSMQEIITSLAFIKSYDQCFDENGNPICNCKFEMEPGKNRIIKVREKFKDILPLSIAATDVVVGLINASKVSSPIILDLDGEGIETLPMSQGVFFDHRGNGFRIRTGWVGPNNGLLVRDINGNGKIDSGRELFGNYTLLKNGKQAANGFEALKELVEVGASVFDNTSPYWNEVMVWIDANSNGITDPDELLTLEEAGVVSIDLSYYVANITDENGNVHREVGTFTRDDESIGDAVDVWFAHYAVESKAVSNLPVSEDVELLPDLTGLGTAYSLHQAIMRDESGQLQSLVEQFAAENDESARRVLARQIMFKWTGKTTTLAALEVITGEKYTGGTGTNAMKIINDAFDRFVDTVYDVLLAQSHLWYLYETMMEQIPDEEGYIIADDYIFDLTDVAYELLNEILNNQETGERQFLEFIRNMYGLILLPRVDLNSMREVLDQENTKYGYVLDSLNKPLIHNQSSNNLKGTNSGNLFWLDGKNNSIQNGNGDDTFLFFGDMGQNTITDGGGNNTIIFFNGINQSDISVNQVLNSKGLNIEIVIEGTAGKITITDLTYTSNYNIVFSDGSMVDLINDFITVEIYTA